MFLCEAPWRDCFCSFTPACRPIFFLAFPSGPPEIGCPFCWICVQQGSDYFLIPVLRVDDVVISLLFTKVHATPLKVLTLSLAFVRGSRDRFEGHHPCLCLRTALWMSMYRTGLLKALCCCAPGIFTLPVPVVTLAPAAVRLEIHVAIA